MGKAIDPAVPPEQISEAYQFYVAGTDQIYPNENLPVIRALSGERTTVDDIEIHQKRIPVEVWGTPVFDEQGNVAYAIAAFQDITERKQAERLLADYNRTLEQQVTERTAALQQSEAELRALFAAVPDPLFVLTAEGRVIEAVWGQTDCTNPLKSRLGRLCMKSFRKCKSMNF